jgi:hypothetical protein
MHATVFSQPDPCYVQPQQPGFPPPIKVSPLAAEPGKLAHELCKHGCAHFSGIVHVHAQMQEGDIVFVNGAIYDAKHANRCGEWALSEILLWSQPSLTLSALPMQVTRTIDADLDQLLLRDTLIDLSATLSSPPDTSVEVEGSTAMASITQSLDAIMELDGAIGAALVDSNSGMTLGSTSANGFPIEVAAAGNTDVVRAKLRVARELGLADSIEDILITLESQYHLIRPLNSSPGLFLYIALKRNQSNLGLARHKLAGVERNIVV